MENKYKISIIIPVYNVELYIRSCLNSVFQQTLSKDIECILVDDCGKDKSVQIVTEMLSNYHGSISFKFLHHEHNKGLSESRNTGIRSAKGEYIYFLDSDDEITPNCLESFYSISEKNNDIDLIQGSYLTPNNKNIFELLGKDEVISDRNIIKRNLLIFDGNVVAAQNRLINRNFILKYNLFFKSGIIHEDNYWTYFLAKHVKKIAYCFEKTYFHRINLDSITHKINIEKEYYSFKTIIEDFSSNIDNHLPGVQKSLIFRTLLHVLSNKFYTSEVNKTDLINTFCKHNSYIEATIIKAYFQNENNSKKRILYKLLRICYKFDNYNLFNC